MKKRKRGQVLHEKAAKVKETGEKTRSLKHEHIGTGMTGQMRRK